MELLRRYSNRPEVTGPLAKAWEKIKNGDTGEEELPHLLKDRLTEEEVAVMGELYLAGWTAVQLGERYGINARSVRRMMREHGVRKRATPVSLTATQVTLSAELYAEGWSLTKIGNHFGVSAKTVHRKLRAAGVAMRPATNAAWVEQRKG